MVLVIVTEPDMLSASKWYTTLVVMRLVSDDSPTRFISAYFCLFEHRCPHSDVYAIIVCLTIWHEDGRRAYNAPHPRNMLNRQGIVSSLNGSFWKVSWVTPCLPWVAHKHPTTKWRLMTDLQGKNTNKSRVCLCRKIGWRSRAIWRCVVL